MGLALKKYICVMIKIIKHKIIWFIISGGLVVVAIVALATWQLNLGVDFVGGNLVDLQFTQDRPAPGEITSRIEAQGFTSVAVQPVEENSLSIKTRESGEAAHQELISFIRDNYDSEVVELRLDSIGPSIGQELKTKTAYALAIAVLAIVIYIAWAFRKVSEPVASWKYGIIAIVAVAHDIIITLGIFSVLGNFYGIEITAPFIAAALTILGYSVNDTIVVFDRIRENLAAKHKFMEFEPIVENSVREVIIRSINTSATTMLALLAILIFGGSTTRDFVLALIIGVAIGTYSSIFLASPLLVLIGKKRK